MSVRPASAFRMRRSCSRVGRAICPGVPKTRFATPTSYAMCATCDGHGGRHAADAVCTGDAALLELADGDGLDPKSLRPDSGRHGLHRLWLQWLVAPGALSRLALCLRAAHLRVADAPIRSGLGAASFRNREELPRPGARR